MDSSDCRDGGLLQPHRAPLLQSSTPVFGGFRNGLARGYRLAVVYARHPIHLERPFRISPAVFPFTGGPRLPSFEVSGYI